MLCGFSACCASASPLDVWIRLNQLPGVGWMLHGFWASMTISSFEFDEFAFLSFIGSCISSFVSFLLVNVCPLMLFQECRDTWCQILVSSSVLFWLQCKNTAASFKLLIWQLENRYWKIHQIEGASFGALQSLFKLMLLQNTVNLNQSLGLLQLWIPCKM